MPGFPSMQQRGHSCGKVRDVGFSRDRGGHGTAGTFATGDSGESGNLGNSTVLGIWGMVGFQPWKMIILWNFGEVMHWV